MTAVEQRVPVVRPERPVGAWRAVVRGWRVLIPVVVVHAVVQALTVLADPVPALTVGFAALVLVSAAALVVGVWCVGGTATAVVDHRPRQAWSTVWSHPAAARWAVAVGLVALAASLLTVWLLPVVLAFGAFLLPPAAAGEPAVRGAWSTLRGRPFRSAVLVVLALVVAAVSAVGAMLLGLFVTGWLSAGLLWLGLGIVGSLLVARYCVVTRLATDGADARRSGDRDGRAQ